MGHLNSLGIVIPMEEEEAEEEPVVPPRRLPDVQNGEMNLDSWRAAISNASYSRSSRWADEEEEDSDAGVWETIPRAKPMVMETGEKSNRVGNQAGERSEKRRDDSLRKESKKQEKEESEKLEDVYSRKTRREVSRTAIAETELRNLSRTELEGAVRCALRKRDRLSRVYAEGLMDKCICKERWCQCGQRHPSVVETIYLKKFLRKAGMIVPGPVNLDNTKVPSVRPEWLQKQPEKTQTRVENQFEVLKGEEDKEFPTLKGKGPKGPEKKKGPKGPEK